MENDEFVREAPDMFFLRICNYYGVLKIFFETIKLREADKRVIPKIAIRGLRPSLLTKKSKPVDERKTLNRYKILYFTI